MARKVSLLSFLLAGAGMLLILGKVLQPRSDLLGGFSTFGGTL